MGSDQCGEMLAQAVEGGGGEVEGGVGGGGVGLGHIVSSPQWQEGQTGIVLLALDCLDLLQSPDQGLLLGRGRDGWV